VKTLSVQGSFSKANLMIIAISTGPAAAAPLADTVKPPKIPYPDLRPRNGEMAEGEGLISSRPEGKPVPGATVTVTAIREFFTSFPEAIKDGPSIGVYAVSDASGHFKMPPLPDNRLYHLTVIAPGFQNRLYGGMDPKGNPVEIRLTPSPAGK